MCYPRETSMSSLTASVFFTMRVPKRQLIIYFLVARLQRDAGKIGIVSTNDNDLNRRIQRSKQRSAIPFLMEIFLLAPWELWKVRNR